MALQKQFTVQLFDQDGTTFKKNVSPSELKNLPTFHSRINSGQGQLVLDLNLPFDDFGEGTDIDFMHICKLYAVDEDNPRGRLIYTGFISRYEPYLETNGSEGVRVTCLGLGSLLTRDFYRDADLTVVHATQDPETIGRAVIDHFNTVYGGSVLSYTGTTTDPVGTNVSVTFTDQKWFDALTKTGELAGTDWWWKIDEQGQYHLKAKPGTATHTFTIGNDVESLVCPKDSEKVVNFVYVRRSGGTETTYTDATSQTDFGTGSPATGRVSKIITDSSLTDVGAADQRGNKEINDHKDEKVKATVTVNTNYDLESIKVGDTCRITHFKKANTFFGSQNMLIASVNYEANRCRLELEEHTADFGAELDAFVNGN